jgi:hypothetical protein
MYFILFCGRFVLPKVDNRFFFSSHPFVILQDTANSAEGSPQENDGSEACQSDGAQRKDAATNNYFLSSFFSVKQNCEL